MDGEAALATGSTGSTGSDEKRRVALASLLACLVLVVAKTLIGWRSNSLGVLSEAVASGLDLVATLITYVSVRMADRPADANHPYGHGKIESFSAFLETGLLFLACGWIVYEAIGRLLGGGEQIRVTPAVWIVLVASMAIDLFRSRALARVARKYDSQALEADALHFSIDFWTTLLVLAGVGIAGASTALGIPALRKADPLAALVVAGAMVYLLYRLGRRSVESLIDTVPSGLADVLRGAAKSVDGVLDVDQVRTRRSGNRTFVDLTVGVSRTLPFDRVHAIADRVEAAVRVSQPRTDVVVHTEPRAHADETLFDHVRAIAQQHDLLIHELSAHQVRGGRDDWGRLVLDLDAEVDERLTLRAAHALVDRVEREIYLRVPRVAKINTHLETIGHEIVPAAPLEGLALAIGTRLHEARKRFPELIDCHDVQVREVEGRIVVSCHATLDGALPIKRVHDITQEFEDYARQQFPQISRFTVHTEPPDAH